MIALLLACRIPPEPALEAPLICHGTARPERPVAPSLPMPEAGGDGRLAVRRVSGEPVVWSGWEVAVEEPSWEPLILSSDRWSGPAGPWVAQTLSAIRLDLTAQDASLAALAAALGRETGLSLAVEDAIARRAITLRLTDASMLEVLDALFRSGVTVESHASGLNLLDLQTRAAREQARRRSQEELLPLQVLLVPLEHPDAGRALLETWCTHYASSRGEGALLGDRLLLKDHEAPLAAGRTMIRELDGPLFVGGPVLSCAGAPYDEPAPRPVPPVAASGWTLQVTPRPSVPPPARPPEEVSREEVLIGSAEMLDPQAAFGSEWSEWETARLDVEAQGAPVGVLGVALSEATGIDLGVSPHAARLPVTMSLHGADLVAVSAALEVGGVWMQRFGQQLWLLSRDGDRAALEARRASSEEQPSFVTEIWPLRPDTAPALTLQAWCTMLAPPHGRVTLLGESAVVSGRQDELAMLRELLRASALLPEDGG